MELIITDVTASCICWFDLGIKGKLGISVEISEWEMVPPRAVSSGWLAWRQSYPNILNLELVVRWNSLMRAILYFFFFKNDLKFICITGDSVCVPQ